MQEDYFEQVRRVAAWSMAKMATVAPDNTLTPLKQMCLKATSKYMAVLDTKCHDLPISLLKDLLPYLNIVDLDRVQPALNLKGISTYSAWVGIYRDMMGPREVIDLRTEEDSKLKVMHTLFQFMFYGYRFRGDIKYISNINFNALLLMMAKYIVQLRLLPSSYIRSYTTELRPVLSVLEASVRCVEIRNPMEVSRKNPNFLYVLHRILDHGRARDVFIRDPDPISLAWILCGRGSQCSHHRCPTTLGHGEQVKCVSNHVTATAEDEPGTHNLLERQETSEGEQVPGIPCKRPRLSLPPEEKDIGLPKSTCKCLDPDRLCQRFTANAGLKKEACPRGQIHCLQIWNCYDNIVPVLTSFLPTWLCLRSLTLESTDIFMVVNVLSLARSLKQLSENSSSSLVDLSVAVLPNPSLMQTLLDACPLIRSFSVEIFPNSEEGRSCAGESPPSTCTDVPLEKLSIKAPLLVTMWEYHLSVLKHSPNLKTLHIAGIRLTNSKLLTTLMESNRCLKNLHFEDMNLADCHSEIFTLLANCKLESLTLKSCRLLEKCNNKEDFLQQLVDSLRRVQSLQSLNLSQNRLAKNVTTLGGLFTGPSPSTIKELDISANFIQSAELLQLGRLLVAHQPPQRLNLNLRQNPLDRDQEECDNALSMLFRVCEPLTDKWNSRDTMADHISNM
ncbi:leucine-rich repeat-containing protein 41 [Aplochiton taeniatus]